MAFVIVYALSDTPSGAANGPQLRRELATALLQQGSPRTVIGASVDADRPFGQEIRVTYDAALDGAETTVCDDVVASTDPAADEFETRPTLPLEVGLDSDYTTLVSWTVPEGRTCTYDLDLRGRWASGADLSGVRVYVTGVAQRPTGENVEREQPEIRRSPNILRAEVKEVDADTLAIRLKTSGPAGSDTLAISPESTLKVVIQ